MHYMNSLEPFYCNMSHKAAVACFLACFTTVNLHFKFPVNLSTEWIGMRFVGITIMSKLWTVGASKGDDGS